MKRWLYIGGGVIIVILIVVAIGIYYIYSSLDSIVKSGVETYGSQMTGAVVKLDRVKIELTSGKGALGGLTVGNPPGFKSETALKLGEISLQLDIASVTQDPVVIKEISITEPEITYEFGLKGNNIDALKNNVDAYTGKAKTAESPKEDSGPGKKLIVEHLYIRKGKVNVSSTELQGKSATAALPEIHLTDIGKKSNGATAGELTEQVLGAIGKGAAQAAASTDVGQLLDRAKGGTPALPGAAKEGGEALKKLFGK